MVGVHPWFACSPPPAGNVSLRRRRWRARCLPPMRCCRHHRTAPQLSQSSSPPSNNMPGGGRRNHANTMTTALAAPVSCSHLVLEPQNHLGIVCHAPPQGRMPPPLGCCSPPGTCQAQPPIPPWQKCTSTSIVRMAHSLTMLSLTRSSSCILSWIVCAFFLRSFHDEHGASSAPPLVVFHSNGLPTETGYRRCVGG